MKEKSSTIKDAASIKKDKPVLFKGIRKSCFCNYRLVGKSL